jgi:hypothetical protein
MSAVEVDRVENGCTASVALETFVLRKSTESPAFVKLHVVFRVERQTENAGHRKLPIVKTPIKVKNIVVPDTVDLYYNYFPAPPSFNPQKMTYTPLHLEDKVNTPDVASDLHQGYNDPLPQDAKARFSDRPNLKTIPLQEMEVPHR